MSKRPEIVQKTVEITVNKNVDMENPLTTEEQKLNLVEKQLEFISGKLKELNDKKWTAKDIEWRGLKKEINELLSGINLNQVKKVFERKFEQQVRLLHDFHTKRYQQSMFRFCFFCCPNWVLRKLKHYKLIDNEFQESVSQVQKTPRAIYFYVHLLYIKLFLLLVSIPNENDKKIHHKEKLSSAQNKIMSAEQKKVKQFPVVIQGNDDKMMQKHNENRIKSIRTKMLQIMANDWKDIIQIQQWCSHSYQGFIQINTDAPIQTFLEFKDCKLKTSYLFQEISSSSFDLRTCLVRKSKSSSKSHQYVLDSLHPDSSDFQLRFWLADNENTPQNNNSIQKYILLAMRIGIKQKILRMANLQYKQKATHWIIHNYVHINVKPHKHPQSHLQLPDNQSSVNSSYQSVSQNQSIDPQKFWWINYREALINAIVQVSKLKVNSKNGSPKIIKQSLTKKETSNLKHPHNNPETTSQNNQIRQSPNTNNFSKNKSLKSSFFKQKSQKKQKTQKQISPNQNMQSIDRLVSMNNFNYNHSSNQI